MILHAHMCVIYMLPPYPLSIIFVSYLHMGHGLSFVIYQWCSPQNCQTFMNFAHGRSRMQMSFKEMVVTIDMGPKLHLQRLSSNLNVKILVSTRFKGSFLPWMQPGFREWFAPNTSQLTAIFDTNQGFTWKSRQGLLRSNRFLTTFFFFSLSLSPNPHGQIFQPFSYWWLMVDGLGFIARHGGTRRSFDEIWSLESIYCVPWKFATKNWHLKLEFGHEMRWVVGTDDSHQSFTLIRSGPGSPIFHWFFWPPKLATPKLFAMRRSSVCAKRSCRRWLFAGPCGSIWTWKKWYDDEHKRLLLREWSPEIEIAIHFVESESDVLKSSERPIGNFWWDWVWGHVMSQGFITGAGVSRCGTRHLTKGKEEFMNYQLYIDIICCQY